MAIDIIIRIHITIVRLTNNFKTFIILNNLFVIKKKDSNPNYRVTNIRDNSRYHSQETSQNDKFRNANKKYN